MKFVLRFVNPIWM